MKEAKLMDSLGHVSLFPFYLFYGVERFFVHRCIAIIKKRVVPSKDISEICYHPFYGSETNVEELLSLARTPSFFAKTQLVLVREAEKLKETCKKKLAQYADNPAPFTCIVLVAGEKLPNNEFFKKIKKNWPDACLEFSKCNRTQRRKWAEKICEEKGLTKQIAKSLLSEVLDESALNLEALERRIEMFSLYLDGDNRISADDDVLLPVWTEVSAEQGYRLTDALLKGDTQETLVLLHRFLEQGTPALLILSRIIWEMRRVHRMQEGMKQGESVEAILQAGRIPPFKKNLYLSIAKKVPETMMKEIFFSLLETDRMLKSSRLDPQWHLENLCKEILQAQAPTQKSAH